MAEPCKITEQEADEDHCCLLPTIASNLSASSLRSDRGSIVEISNRDFNSYGDFFFAPALISCCYSRCRRLQLEKANFIKSKQSEGDLIHSLSINPPAHFPFLELHDDIRHMIYDCLVEPFRRSKEGGSIVLEIRSDKNHKRSRHHLSRNGYDMSVAPTIPCDSGDPRNLKSLSYHPHRHLEREDYATISNLSQVSHQVREEIAKTFWKDVYVKVYSSQKEFLQFMGDRPATWKGIKKISFGVEFTNGGLAVDFKMVDFCNFIAKHLTLSELNFRLNATPEVAREIACNGCYDERNSDGEVKQGKIEWIPAFKKIKVKKAKISLGLNTIYDPQILESDDSYFKRLAKQVAELEGLIEKTLQPPMRDSEMTEQVEYLEARARLVKG